MLFPNPFPRPAINNNNRPNPIANNQRGRGRNQGNANNANQDGLARHVTNLTNSLNNARNTIDTQANQIKNLVDEVESVKKFLLDNFADLWRLHELRNRVGNLNRQDLLLLLGAEAAGVGLAAGRVVGQGRVGAGDGPGPEGVELPGNGAGDDERRG